MKTLPTIHMNGTPAKMLLEGYDELSFALLSAQDAFGKVEFNARDYYPQGPDAWGKARDEWTELQSQLHAIREKVVTVMIHIHEQAR